MNNRLQEIFEARKKEGRAALIIFAAAGFPNMEQSEKDVELAIAHGADVIELGAPF